MDNLTERRLLAIAGIVVITLGMVVLFYGIFTGQTLYQMMGIAGVVIAYLISVLVGRLRKANEKEGPK